MSQTLPSRPHTSSASGAAVLHARQLAGDACAALDEDGFAVLRGVIPEELLSDAEAACAAWTEDLIGRWSDQGILPSVPATNALRERLLEAWRSAGRPSYARSPRAGLVRAAPERMWRILRHQALIGLAQGALGVEHIVAHSIWNARPKAPDQRFTDTPWHQDAQYFPEQVDCRIINCWFPLHDVEADGSCLAFARGRHRDGLRSGDPDADGTGFLGLTAADRARLTGVPVPLRRGDAVIFGSLTPHCATPNRLPWMRWSLDVRFVALADAQPAALTHGIVAAAPHPGDLTGYEAWLASWDLASDW